MLLLTSFSPETDSEPLLTYLGDSLVRRSDLAHRETHRNQFLISTWKFYNSFFFATTTTISHPQTYGEKIVVATVVNESNTITFASESNDWQKKNIFFGVFVPRQ